MDSRYQAIFDQPRPRQVGLSQRGGRWLVLLGSALVSFEILLIASLYLRWLRIHSFADLMRNNGVVFYVALFLPFVPLWYSRVLRRQKRLLEYGEIAIATVKARYRPNGRGPFYVKYGFRDAEGNMIEEKSLDSTNLLREGSGMLVYYNPENMDDPVAQCAAYFQVIVPGAAPDYVDEVG